MTWLLNWHNNCRITVIQGDMIDLSPKKTLESVHMYKKSFFFLLTFSIITAVNAQTASEFYTNAMSYKSKDNYTEAAKLMSKALAADSSNLDYKKEMADIQYYRKVFFEAIPLYEDLVELDANNVTYLARLAEMYSMSPKKLKGVEYAEKAMKLESKDGQINKMLARTFLEVQHYPKAAKLYQEAEKA